MTIVHPYQSALALSDFAVVRLLNSLPIHNVAELIELGCPHEQQYPELLLTGILHPFAQDPRPSLSNGATH